MKHPHGVTRRRRRGRHCCFLSFWLWWWLKPILACILFCSPIGNIRYSCGTGDASHPTPGCTWPVRGWRCHDDRVGLSMPKWAPTLRKLSASTSLTILLWCVIWCSWITSVSLVIPFPCCFYLFFVPFHIFCSNVFSICMFIIPYESVYLLLFVIFCLLIIESHPFSILYNIKWTY